ncbi:MAG: carbohydrate kinase [Betaproteobacteria bacterium]|nr:carbohydrate kinase [Betaproteobacteria bacterium]
MKRLLAFGEVLIDLLEDPHTPGRYVRQAGGAPANVAVGFAKLGGDAAFIGMRSTDRFGEFLATELAAAGANIRHLQTTAAANTALAVVSLDAKGERSFSFYRPPSADLLFDADALAGDAFAGAPYFHFCSNTLTHANIRRATDALVTRAADSGSLISFDVNLRPALWPAVADARATIAPWLARAHVLKLAREEWAFLAAGNDAALLRHCWQGVTELVLITDGAAPVQAVTRAGEFTVAVRPFDVVDSTAAGDAFVAGLLSRLAEAEVEATTLRDRVRNAGWLEHAIRFAGCCGGLACARYGAFGALPMLEDAQAAMKDAAH